MFIISTRVDFRKRPRPRLGCIPNALRVMAYKNSLRKQGPKDEDFYLREKRGSALQNQLCYRPVPRHRALTVLS